MAETQVEARVQSKGGSLWQHISRSPLCWEGFLREGPLGTPHTMFLVHNHTFPILLLVGRLVRP